VDKKQAKIMEERGYVIKDLPNLRKIQRMDFRHPDGRILPRLPVFNLELYLKRGFIPITDPNEPRKDRLSCPTCKATVYGGDVLEEHLSKEHKHEVTPSSRTATIEDTKGGIEPFTCETCGKVFPLLIALKGHLRSHKKSK